MTLEEAVREFECHFAVVMSDGADPKNFSRSLSGEAFVTLTSGGIKPEGEEYPCFVSSADMAVKLWLLSAREYAKDRGGYLYWREKPSIEDYPFYEDISAEHGLPAPCFVGRKFYAVYSRMVVSRAHPDHLKAA